MFRIDARKELMAKTEEVRHAQRRHGLVRKPEDSGP